MLRARRLPRLPRDRAAAGHLGWALPEAAAGLAAGPAAGPAAEAAGSLLGSP